MTVNRTFHATKIFAVAILAFSWALTASAAKPIPVRRIHIAPDDHTDYMRMLDEEGYRRRTGGSLKGEGLGDGQGEKSPPQAALRAATRTNTQLLVYVLRTGGAGRCRNRIESSC